jgi:hypothetical protein
VVGWERTLLFPKLHSGDKNEKQHTFLRGRNAPQIKCAVFSNFAVLFSTASLLQKKKEVLPLMILSNHFETAPFFIYVELQGQKLYNQFNKQEFEWH